MEVISPWAYRLQLPRDLHIHPVQPVLRLSKVAEDPMPGQVEAPPPAVIVNRGEEYEVEWVEAPPPAVIVNREEEYEVEWVEDSRVF